MSSLPHVDTMKRIANGCKPSKSAGNVILDVTWAPVSSHRKATFPTHHTLTALTCVTDASSTGFTHSIRHPPD